MEGRGDGVHQRDYSGHDRNPRVAEGVRGLVAPSRQQFVRRRGGDVAVSVTGWDHGAAPVRYSRRWRDDALPRDWGRRRNDSRCAEIHWISRPLWSLGVEQTKRWQARRPLEG